jgi:hypothetical protein
MIGTLMVVNFIYHKLIRGGIVNDNRSGAAEGEEGEEGEER